jgi:hypothetical protein
VGQLMHHGAEESPSATVTGIFLADDNVIVREGVCTLLEREPDLRVRGPYGAPDRLDGALPSAVA